MQNQIIESVHRSVLPRHVREKLREAEYVRIIYEPDEEANMPPEEDFKPEFIKLVKESEKDFQEGRYVSFETREEENKFFESLKKNNEQKHI